MFRLMLSVFLALALVIQVTAVYHKDVTSKDFDTLLDPSKSHILVEFYAPWCGHCKSLAPEYEMLGETLADWSDIVIAQVDADKHKDLAKRFDVSGFPTLKWVQKGSTFKDAEIVDAGRTAEDLLEYVNKKTGLSFKLKAQAESAVTIINDGNYKSVVLDDKTHAFVGFFAPWCGHCKAMKPSWEDLAKLYADHPNVVVGSVDCSKEDSLCESHKVEGFPTLKYFGPNGAAPETYEGDRSPEDLTKFLSPKAGLDIMHDGNVLPRAGVIEDLGEHLAHYMASTTDEERANMVNVCKEHIDSLDETEKTKFTYYLKVFNKIAEKGLDYIAKEKARLTKIVEAADDSMQHTQRRSFLRRINVLAAFAGGKERV